MKDKTTRSYLLWAFGLAWPLQALASWFAVQEQSQLFRLISTLVMFTPLAAAALARIPLRGMGWGLQLKGKWKWAFAAWLGPVVLTLLGAALYFLLFPARYDSMAYFRAVLGEEGLAQLDAQAMPVEVLLAVQAGSAALLAPFLNVIPALGEEVGWRGALYPRLKERFGVSGGRLAGGLIWGVWHWPLMLLAGYEYGLHYWGAPVLGPLLFCLSCVGMGTLIDLLYEKTDCIWIPALAHGAVNAAAGVPLLVLSQEYADQLILGPVMHGIIGGLPMLLTAAVILGVGRNRTYERREEKNQQE